MNLRENFSIALSAILANKMRSLLTMLGVIIGVYAVSTMLALGQMATTAITTQLNKIGGSQIYVGLIHKNGKIPPLFTQDDVNALKMLPIINVSSVNDSAQIVNANFSGVLNLNGVFHTYFEHQTDGKLIFGRFFNKTEEKFSAPVVIISESTAKKVFGKSDRSILGKKLNIITGRQDTRRDRLTVIGIHKSENSLFGSFENNNAYVPINYTWRYLFARDKYISLLFKISKDPSISQDEIVERITSILKARRGSENFEIQSMDRFIGAFRNITGALQALLAGIGALSLLVGGIGIMNIMLVSVTERTREIGLRKALGAQKNTILGQFLIEAVTLTSLGGLIGYVGSLGTVFLVTLVFPQYFPTMTISAGVAFLALGVSIFIGLVFGVWPARRAAELTPIEALRYE